MEGKLEAAESKIVALQSQSGGFPPFSDKVSKRDGYSPFVGLLGIGKPLARIYKSTDGGCYRTLCTALESYFSEGRRNTGYKVLAVGGCSSDMLNQLWTISAYISKTRKSTLLTGSERLLVNLTSSGGRGNVGLQSTLTLKSVRRKMQVPLQDELWSFLPETRDFAKAWKHVNGKDKRDDRFLEALKAVLHEKPGPACLLIEMAANNMPGGRCPLGSTFLAIQKECRKLGVAIVVDDVMLAVRSGRRLTSMFVPGFQPDGVVIGTKTFGLCALLWNSRSPNSAFTRAAARAPNFSGQETTLQIANDAVRRIQYLETNKVCERLVDVGANGVRLHLDLGGVGAYWLRQPRRGFSTTGSDKIDAMEPYWEWARTMKGGGKRFLPPLDHPSFAAFAATEAKQHALASAARR